MLRRLRPRGRLALCGWPEGWLLGDEVNVRLLWYHAARMAKLVDVADLKSVEGQPSCRFESCSGHSVLPSGPSIDTSIDFDVYYAMAPVTVDLTRTVQRLRALSDPTRLEILALLKPGEQCVCELTSALDAAQSRLSFHLKVLKDAGLVTDRRDGRWVYYTLVDEAVEDVARFLTSAPSSGWRKAARCCG